MSGILLIVAIFIIALIWLFGKMAEKKVQSGQSKKDIGPVTFTVTTEYKIPMDDATPSKPLMDDLQFNQLKENIASLLDLMEQLANDMRLLEMINELSSSAGGIKMTDKAHLLRILKVIFLRDLEKCYQKRGLSFRISTRTAEGQSLLLVADGLNDKEKRFTSFPLFCEALNPVDTPAVSADYHYLRQLQSERVNISVEGEEDFAFSAMLICLGAQEENLATYQRIMHNLEFIIA